MPSRSVTVYIVNMKFSFGFTIYNTVHEFLLYLHCDSHFFSNLSSTFRFSPLIIFGFSMKKNLSECFVESMTLGL